MELNDMYQTAELYSAADFQIYLQYGWTLLDIRVGEGTYPVIYVMKKDINLENNEKEKTKP